LIATNERTLTVRWIGALVGFMLGGLVGPALAGPWPAERPSAPVAVITVQDRLPSDQAPRIHLFDFLFGRKPAEQDLGQQPEAGPQQRPTEPRRRREPPEPKIVELPKAPDARTVVVIGDSQAAGLATGLVMAFADAPHVVISPRVRPASGLVRDDFFNWPSSLSAVLAEGPVDAIVVMLGVNDRQPLFGANGRATDEPRSEPWATAYRARVDQLAAALKATGKPVFWMGLPPTARGEFSGFMAYVNGFIVEATTTHGLPYIDIWPSFTDEEGRYTATGPDIDGTVRRLRAPDGVHFTRSGQRKLAYFVETELRRILSGEPALDPGVTAPLPESPQTAVALPDPWALPPAPWDRIGPVVTLTGAPTDVVVRLAGAQEDPRPGQAPPTALIVPVQSTGPTQFAPLAANQFGPPTPIFPAAPPLPTSTDGYPFRETPTFVRLFRGDALTPPRGRADDHTDQRSLEPITRTQ
jgi:hypothetical protein